MEKSPMMSPSFSLEEERKELSNLAKQLANQASSYDEFASSTKDSSLKRVTNLTRRLRNIPSEPFPQLIKDIQQINVSMHFIEVCTSILENRPKNSAEYMSIVRVSLHLMIETNEEFVQIFCREILRNISSLMQSGVNPSDKNAFGSFRFFFRLACELQLVKATDNKFNRITTIIQKLLAQEEEVSSEFIPFIVYLLKSFKGHLPSAFVGDQLFEKLFEAISVFFKTMCRYSLRLFNRYKNLESGARSFYEQKGDLPTELETELLDSFASFKAFRTSLAGLAELLILNLPIYENSEPQFIIDEGKVIFTSKIEIGTDIYQDEEERDFYEKLPESVMNLESFELPEDWKTSEEIDELYRAEINPDAVGGQHIKIKLPRGVEQFFNQVENIVSIADVDALSEKINAAGKDFKFAQYFEMFFEIARKKNELIKYIARMMACIRHNHPVLIQNMIRSMCGQFHFLTIVKGPIIRTRRRICTFLGEFTKFRLLPQSISFNCLKKCVKDFTGSNIDMLSYLLESSGRFIYLQPESHARMKNLIIKIGNFRKNSLAIPNDKNILLGYALFCVTRTQTINFFLEPDLMETFFSFAFGRLESSGAFVDLFQLIKDENDLKTLQLLIVQTTGLELANLDNLSLALATLKTSNPEFVCKTIDLVMCECISDLKRFDRFNFQEVTKRAQLIGRFFYRQLIGPEVFFGYLYQSLSLGHFIADRDFEDGPEDYARARLILTLLNSLKELRFPADFYSYMQEFMSMLRCYICSKKELTKEIFELAVDVYKAFDDCPLEPLDGILAIHEFTRFPVSNLFIGKLEYLKNQTSSQVEADNRAAIKAQNDERIAFELSELDKEMTRIIGTELEGRKLDRHQPVGSEVHLPFSGLLQKKTGNSPSGTPSILLKKKKKMVLKTLSTK